MKATNTVLVPINGSGAGVGRDPRPAGPLDSARWFGRHRCRDRGQDPLVPVCPYIDQARTTADERRVRLPAWRLVFGSVATTIVRHGPVPVLVVP